MKSYGQFCALARALDHVGDRWTLLIVRELLLSDASYGDLQAALAGVPTNLLADRLRDLEHDGLLVRDAAGADRRRVIYRLTPLGRRLEPTLRALIVWGAHWMRSGPGGQRFDPRWAALALTALLEDRTPSVSGVVEFRFEGGAVALASTGEGRVHVDRRPADRADAVIEGDAALLLGVVSGQLSLTSATRQGLRLRGDRQLIRALL